MFIDIHLFFKVYPSFSRSLEYFIKITYLNIGEMVAIKKMKKKQTKWDQSIVS